ncbi:bola protein [Mariannaea sp. PMI_226]|nr:bola protein [Mariannaea sp. PMI_226]
MICSACRLAARTSTIRGVATSRASSVSAAASAAAATASSRAAPALLHRSSLAPLPSRHLNQPQRYFSVSRALSSSPSAADQELPSMTEAESAIADILVEKLSPSQLLVQDVSGGCGSMYAIDITSEAFRGKTILKQQRMVNAALGDLVKAWHGVQIRTKVPQESS